MKVAIVGSRSLENKPSAVRDAIERAPWMIPEYSDLIIVSGGASGVDTFAEQFAKDRMYDTIIIEPEWQKYGPAAGPKRNTKIVEEADAVVAIWDGKSNGTKDTIDKALAQGVSLYVEQP